jgi:serine/threonine-protein kinase HipA
MLGAKDMEPHSYLEIADLIRRYGAEVGTDMRELFRRIIFNVLISNTDDHLRNHGFLLAGQAGWRLSPAYDLNPVPPDIKSRVLSTSIGLEDATASLQSAFDVADYFGVSASAARSIAGEVGRTVSAWREVARGRGIPDNEIDRMSGAFEHADLHQALIAS